MSPTSTSSTSQHMVTRCPKCSTAFRITNAQLSLAKGAVRCGSCLHIFKATDYLVKAATPDTTKKTIPSTAETSLLKPETKPAITFDKSKALADEEDELISDDMDKETGNSSYEFDGFLDMDMQPKQTVSLFEREIKFEPEDHSEKEDSDDEAWAEELLDDDEPTRPLLKKANTTEQPTETNEHLNQRSGITFSLIDDSSTAPHEENESPRAQPEATLNNDTDEFTQNLFNEQQNHTSYQANHNADETQFSEEFLQATQGSEKQPPAPEQDFSTLFSEPSDPPTAGTPEAEAPQKLRKPIKSAYKSGGFGISRAALLMNIIPAPLEFTTRGGKKRLKQKLWTSLAVIMGLLLLFQLAYFKFNYFGRIEPYRSVYALLCPALGCKVPSLIDKTKIVIYDSHSRTHPHTKDGLLFEFIMRNDAAFEQPFPNILLSFSTVSDTPVAARLFKPSEYLGGELAGKEFIPPKTPVHIEIELKDPGADAVNYEVTIK